MKLKYVANPDRAIRGPRGHALDAGGVERAVHRTRALIDQLSRYEIDIFALLGMRNLSAFVGEVFAAAMILEHQNLLKKNPHQDGYPDLLLLDGAGSAEWHRLADRLREKAPFSPFSTGGYEIKATCGAVPSPQQCKAKGFEKPDIGDQRITLLASYDWKAHHQQTNFLFGLVWDFIEKCPSIVGVFYRHDLTREDWGKIVQPKEGGGRTTSVSIMTRGGVKKMYDGWVVIVDDPHYASFFDSRNNSDILTSALKQRRKL